MGIGCWLQILLEALGVLCSPSVGEPALKLVVDRIEGDRAVIEVGDSFVDVGIVALPPGLREGSVLWAKPDDACDETVAPPISSSPATRWTGHRVAGGD